MNPVPAIFMEDVSFSYGVAAVLENIDLRIEKGEFFGLIGPNASGKSTLLRLILGLLKPAKGMIKILGHSPVASRVRLGYVPQFPSYQRFFPITVADAVMSGRLGISPFFGAYNDADKVKIREVMTALEISDIANYQVSALSGGQIQRMLIARALVCNPEILIMDEPTANVDIKAEQDIFSLLRSYDTGMTIIIVSHDISFISSYVDRVGCLNRTLICHKTDDLSTTAINDLYGMAVKVIDHRHPEHH